VSFWQKIPQANETSFEFTKSQLYAAFQHNSKQALSEALTKGLASNGFSSFAKSGNLHFATKTTNMLPVLFFVSMADDASSIRVTYKAPVPPLKALIEDAIKFILTRN